MTDPETEGVTLSCPHCPHWWTDTGGGDLATCPNCGGTVRIDTHAADEALREAFVAVPRIKAPTDFERGTARLTYPAAVVPMSGPVPDPYYTVEGSDTVTVPEWLVASVVHRILAKTRARASESDPDWPSWSDRISNAASHHIQMDADADAELVTEDGEDLAVVVETQVHAATEKPETEDEEGTEP